jgi:hypothetical protein
MTHKELVKLICEMEGKKVEVSIGNVKEVLKCLKKLLKTNPWIIRLLIK